MITGGMIRIMAVNVVVRVMIAVTATVKMVMLVTVYAVVKIGEMSKEYSRT